jgi:hypothetical protein
VSATEALRAALSAGIRLGIDGDHLTLEASTAPNPVLLEQLACHKASVMALLRPADDGWSALDWLAFFDERTRMAAIHRLAPAEAAASAFACCVVEWLNRNPARSPTGQCLGCGRSEYPHEPLLPFGTEATGNAWLHSDCWPAWHASRKAEAVAALANLGITTSRTSQ